MLYVLAMRNLTGLPDGLEPYLDRGRQEGDKHSHNQQTDKDQDSNDEHSPGCQQEQDQVSKVSEAAYLMRSKEQHKGVESQAG